jgi:F0F1-type ATP synthase membrane subunit b/b'
MEQILQDLKNKVAELEAEAAKLAQDATAEAEVLKAKLKTDVQALINRLDEVLGNL